MTDSPILAATVHAAPLAAAAASLTPSWTTDAAVATAFSAAASEEEDLAPIAAAPADAPAWDRSSFSAAASEEEDLAPAAVAPPDAPAWDRSSRSAAASAEPLAPAAADAADRASLLSTYDATAAPVRRDTSPEARRSPPVVHSDGDADDKLKLKIMRDQAQTLQDEQLRQAKLTFNVAVGLLVLGVLIIFAGTGVILYQNKADIGTLTAAGGAVADVISLILFRFHKVTNDKLDVLRTELNKIESVQFSMTLIERITDPKERNDAIREVVRKLGAQ